MYDMGFLRGREYDKNVTDYSAETKKFGAFHVLTMGSKFSGFVFIFLWFLVNLTGWKMCFIIIIIKLFFSLNACG